jgi:predicted PurR-regulated permease PerM
VSNTSITYLVAACCGVFGLAAFTAFILVPAWNAYSRAWERVAAAFLSLYVLAALLGLGVVLGGVVVWFWDRVFG